MDCQELVRALSSFMDGDLDEAGRRAAEAHLRTRPHCPSVLRTTEATVRLYRRALSEKIPSERRARMLERLREAARQGG